jgi:hypothetical protein
MVGSGIVVGEARETQSGGIESVRNGDLEGSSNLGSLQSDTLHLKSYFKVFKL